MKPDICIFHSPCADGFAAAWAVWKRWPDVEFVPGVYGQAPPDVAGKNVLIVDFSYKLPVLQEMGKTARTITVLDHHKSAQADLEVFGRRDLLPPDDLADVCEFSGIYPIQALFDMEKSGAMLAWEYCHGGAKPPFLIRTVQDRDLWKFEYPSTRAISADLFSRPYNFEVWDAIADELDDDPSAIIAGGHAIERKHHKDIAELLPLTARRMVIGGVEVPVANIPYTMSSDAANTLAEGSPFGACYYDNSEGRRVFSLRSKEGGADVSVIASGYGGGGHARAAGFSAALGWEGDGQ